MAVVNEAVLKEKSVIWEIPFANLLRGYILEEAVQLIYASQYRENLWVCNPQLLGLEAYKKGGEAPLCFYYLESPREIPADKLIPGQKLSRKLAAAMVDEIFRQERRTSITWKGRVVQIADGFAWNLTAVFEDMEIPMVFHLMRYENRSRIPQKRMLTLLMENPKMLEYPSYAAESVLAQALFDIVSRLELIRDMENYVIADEILKTEPVSGRFVLEVFTEFAQTEPQVRNEKRTEMLRSYLEYTYMRKRWEKYRRNKKLPPEPWEEVLLRILTFVEPIWQALCREEVFFDDWMPELGRFLN